MFSCLNCRKALIAKSKSHSEISYDGGKFRDEQYSRRVGGQQEQQQQPLTAAGDDLNDTASVTESTTGHGEEQEEELEGKRFLGGQRQSLDSGLRRSQTQVRGKSCYMQQEEDEIEEATVKCRYTI